jgi:hypothetical protein
MGGEVPGGAGWIARLPLLARECAGQWSLHLERPFDASFSPVIPAGGRVLKLNFPEAETEHEAVALIRWDGHGAVRLLAHDPVKQSRSCATRGRRSVGSTTSSNGSTSTASEPAAGRSRTRSPGTARRR